MRGRFSFGGHMIVKASQREQVRVHGLNFEFEPGEVKEIGPDELARAVLRASDLLVEVDEAPHPVVEDEDLTRSEVINLLGDHDWVHALIDAGYASISALVEASDEELLEVDGVGPARLEDIQEALG